MIFVNFKTYKEGSGQKAVTLAKIINKVAVDMGVQIIACPQVADFKEVKGLTDFPVWTQHVDSFERGKTTGWFPPEIAKELGAAGTLLNHSEHKIAFEELKNTLTRCREIGLKVVAIANSLEEARDISKLKPDFLGYEPPEFVGSTTTSVAMAKPEVIKAVVEVASPVKVLVGAGVHRVEDVRISLSFGAVGVILATDVVLAENPEKELIKLSEGFK